MIPSLLLAALLSTAPTYCDGYKQGFTAAYCQGHQFCVSAPVPACHDKPGSFQEGYDKGYDDGEAIHPRHPEQK